MTDLFMYAQVMGLCGLAVSLAVFQMNKRRQMLRLGVIAALLYTVQFAMLGAYTAAVMNCIGALRTFVFMNVRPRAANCWILGVFMVVAIVATMMTWHGVASMLALVASMCGGIASWQRHPSTIRRYTLSASLLWLVHNILTGAMVGVVL